MSKKSRLCRICDRNNKVIPVRDGLGILRFSAFLRTKDATVILPLWPQLKCGQAHFENRTYNAEKPPKRRFFDGRWSEWQDSNLRHPAPKAGALPTALHPVIKLFYPAGRILPNQARYQLRYTRIFNFCHYTTAREKIKDFSVCGHLCGQRRFCAAFCNRGKSRKRRRRKALRRFASPHPGYNHGTPKASALPTALIPDFWWFSFAPDVVKHVVRRIFWPHRLAGEVPVSQSYQGVGGIACFNLKGEHPAPKASALPTALIPDFYYYNRFKNICPAPT